MIRTRVCWDATVRLVAGAAAVAVGLAAATALFGTFLTTKGLWLVVEEATREAVEGAPRSESLTEK